MTRLVREGTRIRREDGWPGDGDVGRVVLLPGGEAGRLLSWWNADDGSEWRWQVEFYNRRRQLVPSLSIVWAMAAMMRPQPCCVRSA